MSGLWVIEELYKDIIRRSEANWVTMSSRTWSHYVLAVMCRAIGVSTLEAGTGPGEGS